MQITKEFTFDAAHHLPNVPAGHQCARMHGHTYRIEIELTGPNDPEMGWVRDFADVKVAWRPLDKEVFDHRVLNDTLENPTAENLALFIFDSLLDALPELSRVTVWETPTSSATAHDFDVITSRAPMAGASR